MEQGQTESGGKDIQSATFFPIAMHRYPAIRKEERASVVFALLIISLLREVSLADGQGETFESVIEHFSFLRWIHLLRIC